MSYLKFYVDLMIYLLFDSLNVTCKKNSLKNYKILTTFEAVEYYSASYFECSLTLWSLLTRPFSMLSTFCTTFATANSCWNLLSQPAFSICYEQNSRNCLINELSGWFSFTKSSVSLLFLRMCWCQSHDTMLRTVHQRV